MDDESDVAQAGVFLDMLRAEIAEVSSVIEARERAARLRPGGARSTGDPSDQRRRLYELQRMVDRIIRRFPQIGPNSAAAR